MIEKTDRSFVFRPSPEALKHFRDASAEAKLTWLEDAAQFVKDFVPQEKLQKWMRLSKK